MRLLELFRDYVSNARLFDSYDSEVLDSPSNQSAGSSLAHLGASLA
jgi:hypothetical protein